MNKRGFTPLDSKHLTGFTLIELLVAASLIMVVLLAVGGLDIMGRRSLALPRRRARVQNEARLAMEHMVRNIKVGNLIDSDANPGTPLPSNTNEIHVRMDWNPTTSPASPINSPANFDNDYEVWYRYNANQIEWRYRTPPWTAPVPGVWSGWETIAEEVVDPGVVGRPLFAIDPDVRPVFLIIDLTTRYDASSPANPPDNPEVRLHGGVNLRSKARD